MVKFKTYADMYGVKYRYTPEEAKQANKELREAGIIKTYKISFGKTPLTKKGLERYAKHALSKK